MAIGESLLNFGGVMPNEMRNKWMKIFVRISDYIRDTFMAKVRPVINYYAGTACELAMAYRLTGDESYLSAAKIQEAVCRSSFDSDGLLCGEKIPHDTVSPRGCRPIDMGYNMEESLPLLLRYAELAGGDKAFYRERFRDHLAFMLPDGAIDNSWGIRHNKWTYWGSRTSDGAIEDLALLCDDPEFADVCDRVLTMYESCTHGGLLSLPMAEKAGQPSCLHHSFCHAKALAVLAMTDYSGKPERTLLPCEKNSGIRFFQNGSLAVVSVNGWRATISAVDLCYAENCENGGGSMTLLYSDGKPLCASTMRVYRPVEIRNMQSIRNDFQSGCMTPRLVFSDGRDNLLDFGDVTLNRTADNQVTARGSDYSMTYTFGKKLTIEVCSNRNAKFMIPVIKHGEVSETENSVTVGNIRITAQGIKHSEPEFNQVGGFIWVPIEIPVKDKAEISLEMTKL